jgi:hypothetical protein
MKEAKVIPKDKHLAAKDSRTIMIFCGNLRPVYLQESWSGARVCYEVCSGNWAVDG